MAEGHYPWYEVLDQTLESRNSTLIPQESMLVDSQNDTCIYVNEPGLQTLQAIFDFPHYNVNNGLSVDVLMKNTENCSSPACTWFVRSNCSSGVVRECKSTGVDEFGDYSLCRMTCNCNKFELCQSLHFKYAYDQSVVNLNSALCGVKPVYGDVNLPYYGTD